MSGNDLETALHWFVLVMPFGGLVLWLIILREVSRERDLRRRLRTGGAEADALVRDVQTHGVVPGHPMMGLRLSFRTADGLDVDATAVDAWQPGAHSLRRQTVRVVYLPADPKRVRLAAGIEDDAYAQQLVRASRRWWLTIALFAFMALMELVAWHGRR
jgi:hypothetical protein